MSEMIERVAKAIAKTEEGENFYKWEDLARAAIAAMREPTKRMVEAGEMKSGKARDAYRAMISECLK